MFTAALYTTAQNNLCLLMDEWIKKMSYIVCVCTCIHAKLLQLFRLCDPMDCSLPGSSVHEISQARILEWVAMPSSRDLPHPGIKPGSPSFLVDSLPLSHQGSVRACVCVCVIYAYYSAMIIKSWHLQKYCSTLRALC